MHWAQLCPHVPIAGRGEMDAWEARMLVSLLAATVGINAGYTETAAGAVDHVLTGGSSAQAATVPYGRLAPLQRRGTAQEQPWDPCQCLAGWWLAKRTCLNDIPGWQESEWPRAPALLLSDNP